MLSKTVFQELSSKHNEPDWLMNQRLEAFALIKKLPLPEMQQFTYSDWPLIADNDLTFEQSALKVSNGSELEQNKIICEDIFEASEQYPKLVQKYLNSVSHFNEDKLLAYNTAFMNNGLFLYIPDNVELQEPIEIEIIQDSTDKNGLISHIVIVVGKSSKAKFIQHLSTTGSEKCLANLVVEVQALAGSNVEFSSLDEMGENTTLYFNRRANLARDAHAEWNVAFMNDCNTVGDLASELIGEDSYAYSKAIAITTGKQKVAVNNRVINRGPHSTGLINQRGVLLEDSRLIFNGIGQMVHGAHGSKADQQNRVLMMSDTAQGDANPLLLIDENDVIAAHAASVGPVDPIQMNYLMSRGIPYAQAERMVIHGFLDPVLGAIPKGKVKDRMLAILERKLINGQRSYYKNKK
ncbi:Fe-S cluster assembly protein SufD [Lactobacillus helveticus]|uniref:Fe-S cluster assembly protein SufD n=1 Tax=Lactobacillus helveticus TaxID=1587 RepID=UPI001C649C9D|nr:Fe-S cluster assembly protein SufD [Lactobacillus helveticus]MBW7987014.1 Fe-S cluster assembly protein SufD [Lactobacillus helveticus]